MKQTLVRLGLMALVVSTLVGCGGGGGGGGTAATTTPTTTIPGGTATSGTTTIAGLTPADWGNLEIAGSVQGVTINSPPEVTFQLLDAGSGNTALAGFEANTTLTTANATYNAANPTLAQMRASYANIAFSIAKLVPGTNGSPSRWISYIVTTAPSSTAPASIPTRPSTDNTGTLTYLGNGQYKYVFYRDIKQIAAQVAAAAETATNKNADLDDLSYDPNAIHRVAIQISGNMRGTSTNTANGANSGVTAVPLRTPVDIIFDWIPATGRVVAVSDTDVAQREIVNVAACASCHNKFTFHGGNALTGVGGSRQETRMCVVCHTDQRKYGRGEPTTTATGYALGVDVYRISGLDQAADGTPISRSPFELPIFIHKIHMGEELTKTGSQFGGVLTNDVKYPQLIKNCAKCHSGDTTKPDGTANTITRQDGSVVQMATPQGNNWKNKPSRKACGACHDGINFNTGTGTTLTGLTTGHGGGGIGGVQANDASCSTCHSPAAIATSHTAVTPQDRNSTLFLGGTNSNTNAAWLASNFNNLPAGAIKVTYDITSVSRNNLKQPVMTFRILQNGARVDFNTYSATLVGAETLNDNRSRQELWPNFMGAPSAYFVFAVPQDGIAAPADFNASASGYLRSIWNGAATTTGAGTMTGPDANGYYTVTLTGVEVPDSAVMLTGGLGYTYAPTSTMPLTQINLPAYPTAAATGTLTNGMPNKTGGLIVIAPDAQTVASAGAAAGGTGGAYAGRRAIVEDRRCNNCHQELGAFNAGAFHAGQRNDGTTCSWCHNPNRTSSGWAADSTNFIHAIHGAVKRQQPFTWHAASTTDGFWTIGYPGVLKNCQACHIPGSYDFSTAANLAAAPKKLYRYTATGIFNGTVGAVTFARSGAGCATAGTSAQTAEGAFALSPWLPAGATNNATFFGLGFTFNAAKTVGGASSTLCDLTGGVVTPVTVAAQAIRNADATTLVESPLSTVCFACHDSNVVKPNIGMTAKAHMEANGGVIYAARGAGAAPVGGETCLTTCHNPSAATNIRAAHSK